MKTHWSFWLIGIIGLVWNAMGSMNFFMQLSPEMLNQMPEGYRVIALSRPYWATAAFGISVLGGVIGCILLLMKKSTAVKILLLSLLGTLAAIAHLVLSHNITASPIGFGMAEIVLAIIAPVVVSLFLFWYANKQLNVSS